MVYVCHENAALNQKPEELSSITATDMLKASRTTIENALEDSETAGPLQDLLFDQSDLGRCGGSSLGLPLLISFREEWAVHPDRKNQLEGKRHSGRPYGSRNIKSSQASGGIRKRRSGPRS